MFSNIEKFIPPRIILPPNSKIPRIIHQTFEENYVPKNMAESAQTWINLNPQYEYNFYDRHDRYNFISNNFDPKITKAYLSLNSGAGQADIFRACVIYLKGGIYSDLDQECLIPLNNYIPNDVDCLTGIDRNTPHQSFLAYSPKHPIIKLWIDLGIDRILNNKPLHGPWAGRLAGFMGPPALDYAWKIWHHGKSANLMQGDNYNFRSITLKPDNYIKEALKFQVMPSLFKSNKLTVKYSKYDQDLASMGINRWENQYIFRKNQILYITQLNDDDRPIKKTPFKLLVLTNNPKLKEKILQNKLLYQFFDSGNFNYQSPKGFLEDYPIYSYYKKFIFINYNQI